MPQRVQHRLFFALHPPARAVREIASIRDTFPCLRPVPDDQLHVTLLSFPLFPEFPDTVAEEIKKRVGALPACRVVLDRLVLGLRSALLQPSEPVIGLLTLQRALARSVLPPAVQRDAERSFSPHVTLFYGGPTGSTVPIDPISWTAEELVLIHSVHGKGVHNDLARWPLTR